MNLRWVRLAAAATVALAATAILGTGPAAAWQREPDGLALGLALTSALALAAPRRLAWWGAGLVLVLLSAYGLLGYPDGPAYLAAPALTLLWTAERGWRWGAALAAVLLAAIGVCRVLVLGTRRRHRHAGPRPHPHGRSPC